MDEKDLLNAIFNGDEDEDNYPDTDAEKIGYAAYALTKSLESISPALNRLYRLKSLYALKELPDIIAYNEVRMALKHLQVVKMDVDDAIKKAMEVYRRTKKEPDGKGDGKHE